MVTQEDVLNLMEDSQDSPEVAEAAYLAAEHLKTEQINRNLRLRYRSGQGFAKFKEKFTEITAYNSITSESSSYGAQIELRTEEESTRLDKITVDDIDIDLDKVIQDAFSEKIAAQLAEEVRENLNSLSPESRILAYTAIRGYDLGVWSNRTKPDNDVLWRFYSIITGDTPTDDKKTDYIEELVANGCFYVNNSKIILTPAYTKLEDPYEFLPKLRIESPN
ncbi:hypothetical protein [Natrarchaeobaculum sulfurireducens]|uniref:hypothetical protein n=1 Tax=Natrarchaeobaculum sulfurireducens TaxID=2044521 RepID=UPI00105AB0B0|nr:hypothetical protein [Natrarchaeobaculum sulfurireducens]